MTRLKSRVAANGERAIIGYVADLEDLEKRFVVELRIDGWPVRLTRADLFDPELLEEKVGDGCYRFRFTFDDATARSGALAEVGIANSEERLGEPIRIGASTDAKARDGGVCWAGGLRFSGWIGGPASERAPLMRAIVDGQIVAEALADRWAVLSESGGATATRAFEFELPVRFADGRARRARIVDETGGDLPGSPCAFIAFADGLERFLAERAEIESERPRGALYDALFPRAHPMSDFAAWRKSFPASAPALAPSVRATVALIGGGDVEASLASLDGQIGCDWTAVVFADGSDVDIPPGALSSALAEARGVDFIAFAPAGTIFEPLALARLAEGFQRFPSAKIVYGDAAYLAADNREWPLAFPAFDYERLLEQGYAAFAFAARPTVVEAAERGGARDVFELFLSALPLDKPPATTAEAIAHAPGVLVRLPSLDLGVAAERLARAVNQRLAVRRLNGHATPVFSARLPAVKVERVHEPTTVTAIVVTRDAPEKLNEFLTSFNDALGVQRADLIVVDAGSTMSEALQVLELLRNSGIRIARLPGPYSAERAFNVGASIATSDYVVFATTDMTALRFGWLEEMLGRLVEIDVGAVAPTLLWPSGVVQQSGLVVGPGFSFSRAFADLGDGDLGYGEAMAVAREASAASAMGLVVRRRVFNDLGGFDVTRFPLSFAAVDFCLRMRTTARRLVVNPYVKWRIDRLIEGPCDGDVELGDRARRELATFRAQWGEILAADPFYNPLLALAGAPFSALAWPPRPLEPRLANVSPPREWPAGI